MQIPYFNNFALDPHRIQPFAHPPAASGNGQAPPPQAYGIQAPSHHGGDNYGRNYGGGGGGGGYGQSNYPPNYNPQWDHHGGGGGGYPPYSGGHQPSRGGRDDGSNGRRLSERLGGFAESGLPAAGAGLPPKPTAATMDGALVSGNSQPRRGGGRGGAGGPLPPPPPDAKEDPRAAAGKRVSYHDMDLVAEVCGFF